MDETKSESVPATNVDHSLRVITVRLPAQLHEQIKALSHVRHQSMNQLVVSLCTAATQASPPQVP